MPVQFLVPGFMSHNILFRVLVPVPDSAVGFLALLITFVFFLAEIPCLVCALVDKFAVFLTGLF